MATEDSRDARFVVSVNFRETEIRALRNEETVWRCVLSAGGVDWAFAVMEHLRSARDLLVGRRTAEVIIVDIGSAIPLDEERTKKVRGRDLKSGLPTEVEVTSIQVREVLDSPLLSLKNDLVLTFHMPRMTQDQAIQLCPPRIPVELMPALANNPIALTGEFGRLKGLDRMLMDATGLTFVVSDSADE